jgi:hypothetical protein
MLWSLKKLLRQKAKEPQVENRIGPVVKTRRTHRAWVWTVAGTIAIALIITVVGLIGINSSAPQDQTSPALSERAK